MWCLAAQAQQTATANAVDPAAIQTPTDIGAHNHDGMIYRQCGSTSYPPQGAQYRVINPPY